MKRTLLILKSLAIMAVLIQLPGCYVEYSDPTPGPPGPPGQAFIGIDYEDYEPYSYWDDNPSVPYNPALGAYYNTGPGIFEFEYFINPWEYWYGTYEIWLNAGGPGRPYGSVGLPGPDNYLMLICDYWGFHEHRGIYKTDNGVTVEETADGELTISGTSNGTQFKVKMKKANVKDRPAHDPKLKSSLMN